MTSMKRFATVAFLAMIGASLTACGDTGDTGDTGGAQLESQADGMGADGNAAGGQAAGGALVDPNTATEAELSGLPGMDSATVALIVAERPFDTMLPLDSLLSERVDSVARDSLYRAMFIPLNLDTASREEILLIPGVGDRMAHEFEEYRPYEGGLAEFRQEIGKYVDDTEVARLERYVTVR